jgi:uncharacterized repeat protein (TIGR03803 family)
MRIFSSRTAKTTYLGLFAAISTVFVVSLVVPSQVSAQTFNVIHSFTGDDGLLPQTGLTMDAAGNLYGTTAEGGNYRGGYCSSGCGTVFKLSRRGSGWTLSPLYNFHGDDGATPSGRVTIAPDGSLYGLTNQGGSGHGVCQFGCGIVYRLTPPSTFPRSAVAPWNETIINYFDAASGWYPQGDVAFDQQGNFYVTATDGGPIDNNGALYQFAPSGSGWTSNLVYAFPGSPDGANPISGVVIDSSGALYGITLQGGRYAGVIYKVSWSGTGWTETVLYNLDYRTGVVPVGGLIIAPSGEFYGTTTAGGTYGAGTVYEFANGTSFRVLTNLAPIVDPGCSNSYLCGPLGKLAMDRNGNLYGTVTAGGVYGAGTVFKLSPGPDGWTYTSLHDFTGQSDPTGAYPSSSLIIDSDGNIYGTASEGGTNDGGTVFEITP